MKLRGREGEGLAERTWLSKKKGKRPVVESLRLERAKVAAFRYIIKNLPARDATPPFTDDMRRAYYNLIKPGDGEAQFIAGWNVPRGRGSTTQLLDAAGVVWEVCAETEIIHGAFVVKDRWVEPVELRREPAGTYAKRMAEALTPKHDLSAKLRESVEAIQAVTEPMTGVPTVVRGRGRPRKTVEDTPPESAA